jgi:tRNA A-37 threonylcarbamoyl transferase component Bud32
LAAPNDVPEAANHSPQPATVAFVGEGEPAITPPQGGVQRCLPRRFGGYELLEQIGKGGMGVVYKARHLELGRLVAVKTIRGGHLTADAAVERFRREARAAASLDHPGIVPVFEVGEVDGEHFFAMALVCGGSLHELLAEGPLPPVEAAGLVRSVAEAVQYAHERGVIHRDLKPHNILLAVQGPGPGVDVGTPSQAVAGVTPKLTDFGVARTNESGLSVTGEAMGTPSYMPPEQARGDWKRVGPASDVYGLGAVLYCALTGRPPFSAAAVMETMRQVLHEEPVPPRWLNPAVPSALETVCLKCLDKEPAKRYGSARELADDLGRFLQEEPVKARGVGPLGQVVRWAHRRPAVAALLGAIGVLVVGGTGGITYFWHQASDRANQAAQALVQAQAEAIRKETEDREKEEAALARNLGRSLENRAFDLTPTELGALRDLAEQDNERVRLRFLAELLRRPDAPPLLCRRGEYAVQAAVGLEAGRRQRVLRAVRNRLQDQKLNPREQEACVLLAADLRADEATAWEAVKAAGEWMARVYDGNVLRELGKAAVVLAGQLGPRQAAAAAQQTLDALARTSRPDVRRELLGLAGALARQLGPEQAAAAARQALEAMAKTTDPNAMIVLGKAVSALAERLGPEQAAETSTAVVNKVLDGMVLDGMRWEELWYPPELEELVSGLAGRLGPGQAAAAAQKVLEAMAGSNDNPVGRPQLVGLVGVLVQRLGPEQADVVLTAATQKVLDALRNSSEWDKLGEYLDALVGRLGPEQAAVVSAAATEKVLLEPSGADRPGAPGRAVAALAGRLGPEQAAAAMQKVLDRMARTTDPDELAGLGAAVDALAGRLGPKQVPPTVQQAIEVLAKSSDPNALRELGRAVEALARRLGPEQAAAAAQTVLDTMAKTTDPHALAARGIAVGALARCLGPEQAAGVSAPATKKVLDALAKATDPYELAVLGRAVGVLAKRLGPEQAAGVRTAAQKVLDALARKIDDDRVLRALGGTVSALAVQLGPEQAAAAAQQFLEAMPKPLQGQDSRAAQAALAEAVGALARQLDPEQAAEVSTAAAQKVLDAMPHRAGQPINVEKWASELAALGGAVGALADRLGPEQAATLSAAAVQNILGAWDGRMLHHREVREAGAALARRTSLQGLIDLLKGPTCVGSQRRLLLEELGRRMNRPFRDHWEAADWLHEHWPDLDLTSPPRRLEFTVR